MAQGGVTFRITQETWNSYPLGKVLWLRYDPAKPGELYLAGGEQDPGAMQRALDTLLAHFGLLDPGAGEVSRRGVAAQAAVAAADPTGNILPCGAGEYRISLRIPTPEGGNLDVTVVKPLLRQVWDLMQVGRVLEVRYLPERPESLIFTLDLDDLVLDMVEVMTL